MRTLLFPVELCEGTSAQLPTVLPAAKRSGAPVDGLALRLKASASCSGRQAGRRPFDQRRLHPEPLAADAIGRRHQPYPDGAGRPVLLAHRRRRG